ncbi:MAG: hypothetical protein DRP45_11930 [Candidatus Zixiibacteriota bacterium]|nr:MAG: hypothetical protein DRP45_11930 [candidate division Zixibacteria bacterium]
MKSFQLKAAGLWILTATVLLCMAVTVSAETFVSFNGNFSFSYPETWIRIDYNTADYYLSQAGGNPEYEAAFAANDSTAIFQGSYLVLTVDTVGELSTIQIDSVVDLLSSGLNLELAEVTTDEFMTSASDKFVQFSSELKAASAVSILSENSAESRVNLLAVKFYKHGVANFYFYCLESKFDDMAPVFKQIFTSFSDENIEDALKVEPLKIADVNNKTESNAVRNWGLIGGVVVILLIIIATRRIRRKS